MTETPAICKQPKPYKGKKAIKSFLGEFIQDRISHLNVVEDIKLRLDQGEKEYGQALETFNGRIAVIDYYQDLLDALVYAIQLREEAKHSVRHTPGSTHYVPWDEEVGVLFELALTARRRMENEGLYGKS